MLSNELKKEILDADISDLEEIIEMAVKARKVLNDRLGMKNYAELEIGDSVRLSDSISPKLLRRKTAKIVGKEKGKIKVDLDIPQRSWHRNVICQPESLTKI